MRYIYNNNKEQVANMSIASLMEIPENKPLFNNYLKHMDNKSIVAFSYFYDIFLPFIPKTGVMSLYDIKQAAICICNQNIPHIYKELILQIHNQPYSKIDAFMFNLAKEYMSKITHGKFDRMHCIWSTYLYTILRNGYGIPLNSSLLVKNKIGKYELAWSLGTALSKLEL